MAENYAARKDGSYKVVGMAPDLCFTPGIVPPVPYPVTTTLAPSKSTVNSVNFNGHPAFVYSQSFVPTTIGDAAGRNKGVVSGTVEGDCWSIEHSPDTYIGGHPVNRVNDIFAMNGKAVGGRGGASISKHEAWERRKALIAKGKQSSDPKVRAAAERLELNNTGVEKARLAENIYGPKKGFEGEFKSPEGWEDISEDPKELAKLGLTPEDLENSDAPGLRVRVYKPDESVFGNDMSPSVVFRGTRPTELEDWKNNAYQGLGVKSPYYQQSVAIGKVLKNSPVPIDCTGHSLGGGLASACSKSSGKPGWTFNSAGLNRGTVEKYGGKNYDTGGVENINAYRVKGEVLTMIQEPGFWGGIALMGTTTAIGAKVGGLIGGLAGFSIGGLLAQSPDAVGRKHDMEGGHGDPIARHGMEQVIPCIEAEKKTDEDVLSQL